MNYLNSQKAVFYGFQPRKLSKDKPDNCSGHCPTQVQKILPLLTNNKTFWTYRCKCCSAYQIEEGKVSQKWRIYG